MDRYTRILDAIPGLRARLREAGAEQWLDSLPTVDLDGQTLRLIGDRMASTDEARLQYAILRGLVDEEEVARADTEPLPPDVESIEIDTRGDE